MILNDKELELWKLRLGIDKYASDLIDTIRNTEPVRSVKSGRGNVSGRYPSRKMGRTIQFESHTCELAFILLCEFPEFDDVLEYWDQPTKLKITYRSKNGRTIRTTICPDFLVMYKDKVEFVECKTEEELVSLAKDKPNKYYLDAEGQWRCPPAEEAAAKYGIGFRIMSTAEIDRTLIRNMVFLEDYLREDSPQIVDSMHDQIMAMIKREEGMRLSTLLNHVIESEASADAIYQLGSVDISA
jgi:putative transposase